MGPDEVAQIVSDGLNEKGLSVTVQWDYDVPGYPNATSSMCVQHKSFTRFPQKLGALEAACGVCLVGGHYCKMFITTSLSCLHIICACRHALSAIDLSAYILSSFGTVEECRKALDPAVFSVVNFQMSPAATATLRNSGLLSPGGFPLIHLGLHDAAHDSLVIEFEGD